LRWSFKTRLFITFFLYGLLVGGIIIITTLNFSKKSIQKVAIENAKSKFIEERNLFKFYFSNVETKLQTIQESKIFQRHIKGGIEVDDALVDLFSSIARSDNFIMQLRLLDAKGNERVRIDRNVCFSLPYVVPKSKLQNKKERYYFQKILSLNKDEYWTSKLDLNVEHGKIEKPYKPVIRVGTPVFDGQNKRGIIIINIFMKKLLEQFTSSKLYNSYIVDHDGYFIIHPNGKYNFSRYTGFHLKLENLFPNDYKQILNSYEYKTEKFYSASLGLPNGEGLKMIIEPTHAFITANHRDLYKNILLISVVLLLLSIPIAFFLAKPYAAMKAHVDHINENLESLVDEKTKALQELNKTLEKKIEDRTHEQNILLSLFDLGDAVLFKWRNDEHWSVEYVSHSVHKLLGYTHQQFLNAEITYAKCVHPEDLQRVIEEVGDAINKKLY